MRGVDAGVEDADVHAGTGEPERLAGGVDAVVGSRGIHRHADHGVVVDADDARRRCEPADLPGGQTAGEPVDDAEPAGDGERAGDPMRPGEAEGTVGRHHHRLTAATIRLLQATLEHVVDAIAIRRRRAVRDRYRCRLERGAADRQASREASSDNASVQPTRTRRIFREPSFPGEGERETRCRLASIGRRVTPGAMRSLTRTAEAADVPPSPARSSRELDRSRCMNAAPAGKGVRTRREAT